MREGLKGRQGDTRLLFLLALLVIVFLLIFVNKPLHIDDTVFVTTARYLTEHPLTPFGAQINWGGVKRSIFYEDNPFLFPYYLAPFIKTFGESEIVLHVSCFVFPLVALFSMYGIAKQTTTDPLIGMSLLVLSPAFLVSATTLMADIPLIALYLLSCYFYMRFCETENKRDAWLFAICVAACSFTKYIGLSLIPLFLVDSWLRGLLRKTALYLCIPLLLFGAWCMQNILSFGAIHILEAGQSMNFHSGAILKKIVASFSFTGLSILGFTMFNVWNNRHDVILWLLLFGIFLIIIHFFQLTHFISNDVLLAVGISGAIVSFAKILNGDSDRFLLLWFCGMLIYSWLSEFIAARVVLLLAPPLALLLSEKMSKKMIVPAFVLNMMLSLMIGTADLRMAEFYKNYAENLPVIRSHYVAHWGLQYYLEQRGLSPLDYPADKLIKGDFIVVPQVAGTSFYPIPAEDGAYRETTVKLINSGSYDSHMGIFVMNSELDAGWYCHGWGLLPFSYGFAPLERIRVYQVSEVAKPEAK